MMFGTVRNTFATGYSTLLKMYLKIILKLVEKTRRNENISRVRIITSFFTNNRQTLYSECPGDQVALVQNHDDATNLVTIEI